MQTVLRLKNNYKRKSMPYDELITEIKAAQKRVNNEKQDKKQKDNNNKKK